MFPLLLRALDQEIHHRLAFLRIDFAVVVFVESIQQHLQLAGAFGAQRLFIHAILEHRGDKLGPRSGAEIGHHRRDYRA